MRYFEEQKAQAEAGCLLPNGERARITLTTRMHAYIQLYLAGAMCTRAPLMSSLRMP